MQVTGQPDRNTTIESTNLSSRSLLRNQVDSLLDRADREPDKAERWRILQKVRELLPDLRGFNLWPAVACATIMFVVLALVANRQQSRDFSFSAPIDRFQILKRFDAYHYEFRHIHTVNGITTATDLGAVFCPNYEPQLSAGQTLTWLHYTDLGRCWDILPEHYGYSFETRDGLHPTLAPNCFVNDRDMTECKPNRTEAKF